MPKVDHGNPNGSLIQNLDLQVYGNLALGENIEQLDPSKLETPW